MYEKQDEEKERRQEAFMALLSRKRALDVLQFLATHEEATYRELQQFTSTFTLNTLLKGFVEHNLIVHHMMREERREWYEITAEGENVLRLMNELRNMARMNG